MRRLWSIPILFLLACTESGSGPEALFVDRTDGLLTEMPWPSDAYLTDGHIKLAPLPLSGGEAVLAMQAALESMDGFGTTTSFFFPVSGPVTLPTDAAAIVVDLEKQMLHSVCSLYFRESSSQVVALAPRGMALEPGHMYGVIVAGGVTSPSGALRPAAAMREAFAAKGRFATIPSYVKLAQYIKNNQLSPQAATAFTTHKRLDWFAEASPALAATPHNAVVDRVYAESEFDFLLGKDLANTKPGQLPGGGVNHESIGWVIRGRMTGPNFLAGPNNPAAAALAYDGTLEQNGTLEIPWILVLPKKASYANTRVVHFQHGLGSNRSNVMAVANEHAKKGFATFGIDALFHGDRVPEAVDNKVNATKQDGADGFADLGGETAVINLFAINGDTSNNLPAADLRIMRDNFRQAAIDVMQAIRFEKGGDLSAIRAANPAFSDLSLDGSKLVYTGESFGAILGGIVLALDPELEAGVLDVGGGGMVLDLVAYSPSFAPLFGPVASLFIDNRISLDMAVPPARAQLALNFAAMIFEPADGLALAPLVDNNKHALLLEAKDDEVVPNTASEALASAWSMKHLRAPMDEPTQEVTLPFVLSPYKPASGTPVRVLVQITGSTHTQYSLQEDSSRWVPPWPPYVQRDQNLHVVHPIQRVRDLAIDFIDSIVAGEPAVVERL